MLGFVLGEMWQGLRRNTSMVVSVVLVTFVSLTFVGASLLLQLQIQSMKSYWYDRAQVAVDLCSSVSTSPSCNGAAVTDSQRAAVEAQLEDSALAPYIEEYFYEDQDAAYQRFADQFRGDPMVSFVTPEQLGSTYWVNLKNPADSDIVIETLSGMPGVESVTDQRALLDGIFAILNGMSIAAAVVAAIMLVAAVLLVATTIRLSAFARRRELGIMRLVGASNGFIQAPFILEGVCAGLIGGVLAAGAVLAGVRYFVDGYLAAQMPAVPLVGIDDAALVAVAVVVAAILLAAIASWFSIRRYLRV